MSEAVTPVPLDAEQRAAIAVAARDGLGDVQVTDVAVLAGGHSGLTLKVALAGDGPAEAVVKATPPGRRPVGRHDVLRQARIVDALGARGDVPVAQVLFRSEGPPALFGSVLVPGVAVDPVIEAASADETPVTVAAAWTAAIDVLVRLHATPVDELALGPEQAREPGEELAVWAATIAAARLADDRAADTLIAALGAAVPERTRLSVVHGDFRLGNLIMQGPRPRALIDWEIWSLGDPAVDLGWFVQFTDPSNFPGIGRNVPGTPSAETVLARYCAEAGEDRGRLDWFLALGCLKLAAIQAHNRRRHLDGRYHDPYQELLGPSIARLLERGLELVPGRAGAPA